MGTNFEQTVVSLELSMSKQHETIALMLNSILMLQRRVNELEARLEATKRSAGVPYSSPERSEGGGDA